MAISLRTTRKRKPLPLFSQSPLKIGGVLQLYQTAEGTVKEEAILQVFLLRFHPFGFDSLGATGLDTCGLWNSCQVLHGIVGLHGRSSPQQCQQRPHLKSRLTHARCLSTRRESNGILAFPARWLAFAQSPFRNGRFEVATEVPLLLIFHTCLSFETIVQVFIVY